MMAHTRVQKACQRCKKLKRRCSATWPCKPCVESANSCKDHTQELVILSTGAMEPSQALEEASYSRYGLDSRHLAHISFHGFLVPLGVDKEWTQYRLALEACVTAGSNDLTVSHYKRKTEAIEKYDLALAAIRAAINDPKVAKEDETLVSILLLVIFECICPTTSKRIVWRDHMKAAVALSKQRGRELVGTETDYAFKAIRTQMIIYSLVTLEGHDDDQLWWFANDDSDDYTSIQKHCVAISSLRIQAESLFKSQQDTGFANTMLQKCLAYDKQLKEWSDNLLGSNQRFSIASERAYDGSSIASERTNLWLFMLWSMQVCARLLLNSIILRCIKYIYGKGNYKSAREYIDSRFILQEITGDINTVNGLQEARSSFTNCGGKRRLYGLQEQVLTWPLGFIWSLDCFDTGQKVAVSTMLEHIGQRGFRAAQSLQEGGDGRKRTYKIPQTKEPVDWTEQKENLWNARDNLLLILREAGTPWDTISPLFGCSSGSLRARYSKLQTTKDFSEEQDKILIDLREEDLTWEDISKRMNKSKAAVTKRYQFLRPGGTSNRIWRRKPSCRHCRSGRRQCDKKRPPCAECFLRSLSCEYD